MSFKMTMRIFVVPTWLTCLVLGACGPAMAQEAAPLPRNANPLSAIDPGSLTGFRDRPLFSLTRQRPPEPVLAPAREPEPEPDFAGEATEPLNIRLLGIVGTPGGLIALVLDLDDETRHSLRPGETFHDWTVSALDGTEMVMSRDSESQRFPVFTPTDGQAEDAAEPPSGDATP